MRAGLASKGPMSADNIRRSRRTADVTLVEQQFEIGKSIRQDTVESLAEIGLEVVDRYEDRDFHPEPSI